MRMLTLLVSVQTTLSLVFPSFGLPSAAFAGSSSFQAAARLTSADPTAPLYKPRSPRPPRARIESGARGQDGTTPNVIPLVPDHIGLTIATQPVLYWYLSRPITSTAVFVLLDAKSVEVLNKVALTPPFQMGVHVLRLKDYGITLEKDIQYRWYVAIVLDPESPSRDLVAGGMIERIAQDGSLPYPPPTNNLDAVRSYAEAGLWYDAIASISDLISAAPHDHLLRKQRASLLRQVGLGEVAEWDLREAGRP